jgi:hypothetical protein
MLDLYAAPSSALSEAEILDLMMLCVWYHAISFAANGAQECREDQAPRFDDYLSADPEHGATVRMQATASSASNRRRGKYL